MKNKILYTLTLLLLAAPLLVSAQLVEQWTQQIGTDNHSETLLGMDVDSAGNIYVVGTFKTTGTEGLKIGYFKSGLEHPPLQSAPGGSYDFYVIKYDAEGYVVTANNFRGKDNMVSEVIQVAPSGKVYIGGYFDGTLDIGGYAQQNSNGGYDCFIMQVDPQDLFVEKIETWGSVEDDFLVDMEIDDEGNVYVTGIINGNVTGALNIESEGKMSFIGKLTNNLISVYGEKFGSELYKDQNDNYGLAVKSEFIEVSVYWYDGLNGAGGIPLTYAFVTLSKNDGLILSKQRVDGAGRANFIEKDIKVYYTEYSGVKIQNIAFEQSNNYYLDIYVRDDEGGCYLVDYNDGILFRENYYIVGGKMSPDKFFLAHKTNYLLSKGFVDTAFTENYLKLTGENSGFLIKHSGENDDYDFIDYMSIGENLKNIETFKNQNLIISGIIKNEFDSSITDVFITSYIDTTGLSSNVEMDSIAIEGVDSVVYNQPVITAYVPYGTLLSPGVNNVSLSDKNATCSVESGVNIEDTTYIHITAENIITDTTYKLVFKVNKSKVVELDEITVDGSDSLVFDRQHHFTAYMPYWIDSVPGVDVSVQGHNASFVVDAALELSDTTAITLYADDTTHTKHFTVSYVIEDLPEPRVLSVGSFYFEVDSLVPEFYPDTFYYHVYLPESADYIATFDFTLSDDRLQYEFYVPENMDDTLKLKVWVPTNFKNNTDTVVYNFALKQLEEAAYIFNQLYSNCNIYPNPVENVLFVECENNTDVTIFNALGMVVYQGTQKSIDMGSYEPGMYFVQTGDNGVFKVIKK